MKKILCLHDSDSGRDIQVLAPILYCLKEFRDCEIIHGYIFDMYLIAHKKPDLVLLANAVGSREHFFICRDCHKRNIPVFALTAEGNVPEAYYTKGNDWGWNTDKVIYHELLCFWSNRTMDIFKKVNPNIDASKLVLTGATGFDIYKMVQYCKEKISIYNRGKYKTVVGYAGWGFGQFYSKTDLKHINKIYQGVEFSDYVKWGKEKKEEVLSILEYAVVNNPDVLFILKKHPKEHAPSLVVEPENEMSSLEKYPNVIYLKTLATNMSDLIRECDLWTCFESTTVMEAWLLGIDTVNILPQHDTRISTHIASGSSVAIDALQFDDYIRRIKQTKVVSEVETIKKREDIIKYSIGYSDGYNHLRALHYIENILSTANQSNRVYKYNKTDLRYFLLDKSMRIALRIPVLNKWIKVKKHTFILKDYSNRTLNNNLQAFYEISKQFYSSINFNSVYNNVSRQISNEEQTRLNNLNQSNGS